MSARLTQTLWNGIVSQSLMKNIRATFTRAKRPHAASSQCLRARRVAVAHIANRFDEVASQLPAQATDVDVDHVRARVERVSPDCGEQLLAGADLALPAHEVLEEVELSGGEGDASTVEGDGAPLKVEPGGPCVEEPRCVG